MLQKGGKSSGSGPNEHLGNTSDENSCSGSSEDDINDIANHISRFSRKKKS